MKTETEQQVTTLAHWNQWKQRCDIEKCSGEAQGPLCAWSMRNYIVCEKKAPELETYNPPERPSQIQAFQLLEYQGKLINLRVEKLYKEYFFDHHEEDDDKNRARVEQKAFYQLLTAVRQRIRDEGSLKGHGPTGLGNLPAEPPPNGPGKNLDDVVLRRLAEKHAKEFALSLAENARQALLLSMFSIEFTIDPRPDGVRGHAQLFVGRPVVVQAAMSVAHGVLRDPADGEAQDFVLFLLPLSAREVILWARSTLEDQHAGIEAKNSARAYLALWDIAVERGNVSEEDLKQKQP